MVSHQDGLSLKWSLSGWSLIKVVFLRVVFHLGFQCTVEHSEDKNSFQMKSCLRQSRSVIPATHYPAVCFLPGSICTQLRQDASQGEDGGQSGRKPDPSLST